MPGARADLPIARPETESPLFGADLMGRICGRDNLQAVLRRARSNTKAVQGCQRRIVLWRNHPADASCGFRAFLVCASPLVAKSTRPPRAQPFPRPTTSRSNGPALQAVASKRSAPSALPSRRRNGSIGGRLHCLRPSAAYTPSSTKQLNTVRGLHAKASPACGSLHCGPLASIFSCTFACLILWAPALPLLTRAVSSARSSCESLLTRYS